jgi:hypothetical protein
MKNCVSKVALVALVVGLVACASDISDTDANLDGPTSGEAWDASDGTEPDDAVELQDDEAIEPLTTPEEDSAPYFEPDTEFPNEVSPTEKAEMAEDAKAVDTLIAAKKCRRATAYKRGKRYSICVTKINGKLVEVNTARKYLKLRAAAARKNVTIKVVSGFRTMAQQRALYRKYKQGRGPIAAPPGYSNHQSGLALDLNTRGAGVYAWLTKHGKTYGFRRTVPSEKWHWER